jgi:type IV secretion system protein VirD4
MEANMKNRANEFLRDKPGRRSVRTEPVLLLVPVIIMITGFFFFAGSFAERTGHNPAYSGRPVYSGEGGLRIYNPLVCSLYILAHPFERPVEEAFFASLLPLLVSAGVAVAVYLSLAAMRGKKDRAEKLYGSARWANERDLRRFGLAQDYGVVLAQQKGAEVGFEVNPLNASISLKLKRTAPLVCHSGGVNTLMIAPTRSGKGVSSIIPTCLCFPQSMIIYDPKGELFKETAGFRSSFSYILKFSPLSYDTVCFNPLEEVELNERGFADVGLILSNMFDGAKEGDDNAAFFANSAKDFLSGLILHILSSSLYGSGDRNLKGVLSILSEAASVTTDALGAQTGAADGLLHEMLDYSHYDRDGNECAYLDDIVRGAASRCLGMNEKVRQDVFSTIFAKMNLFQDPYIAYVTSKSDFRLDDFYESPSPISLYLTVPWSDIARIAPVFKILINFMLNKFSRGEASYGSCSLKNRILFLIDEFPTLGHFPFIAQSMGILAGYGITFYIIVQALNQITDKYGANHSFLDNCKTVCLFAPGKIEDAKMFSEMIGKESVLKQSVSSSGNRFSAGLNNLNTSSQEVERSLINPDELMKMPPSDAVIYNQGMPPYMAKKVVYYMDSRFSSRSGLPAPATRALLEAEIRGLPSYAKRTDREGEGAGGRAV